MSFGALLMYLGALKHDGRGTDFNVTRTQAAMYGKGYAYDGGGSIEKTWEDSQTIGDPFTIGSLTIPFVTWTPEDEGEQTDLLDALPEDYTTSEDVRGAGDQAREGLRVARSRGKLFKEVLAESRAGLDEARAALSTGTETRREDYDGYYKDFEYERAQDLHGAVSGLSKARDAMMRLKTRETWGYTG